MEDNSIIPYKLEVRKNRINFDPMVFKKERMPEKPVFVLKTKNIKKIVYFLQQDKPLKGKRNYVVKRNVINSSYEKHLDKGLLFIYIFSIMYGIIMFLLIKGSHV